MIIAVLFLVPRCTVVVPPQPPCQMRKGTWGSRVSPRMSVGGHVGDGREEGFEEALLLCLCLLRGGGREETGGKSFSLAWPG